MPRSRLILFALLDVALAFFEDSCRTEHFPQPFDYLNDAWSIWNVVVTDSLDQDILNVGGDIGSFFVEPLLAKYDAAKLRFAWIHAL